MKEKTSTEEKNQEKMERIYIKDLHEKIGEGAKISGFVSVRRDHGKIIFLDIRDRSGELQCVSIPSNEKAHEMAGKLRSQWAVSIEGMVNTRPEKMMNSESPNGDIELLIEHIEILAEAEELPFEIEAEVNLDTYLDYLPLTLRRQRARDIFTVEATVLDSYRQALRKRGFTEFVAPALVGEDAEGGAAAFKVHYYYDQTAFLATSPQFYKQIMIGPFERVFTIAKIFRGEKHSTTRHLSEITQMDFEMGFITDHTDVIQMLETIIRETIENISREHFDIFDRFGAPVPLAWNPFPILTLRDAQKIISERTGIDCANEPDLDPEHERVICEWAQAERNSDFVFITHFPTKKRAFYTSADEADPEYSKSFDLLFRGLEINSGSQRIHKYDELVARMKERGLDPEKFSFYLQAFKYGLPPHGGCYTGLERFVARLLELPNVKEAAAFPRDLNRIDVRLSTNENNL